MSVPKVEGRHVVSMYFFFFFFDWWSIVKLRGLLGRSLGLLGLSLASLGASWGALGPSWGPLGPVWGPLGASWRRPKSIKKSIRKLIPNRVGSGRAKIALELRLPRFQQGTNSPGNKPVRARTGSARHVEKHKCRFLVPALLFCFS